MSIVLFAIIGATINAGAGYWICYSIFCVIKFFQCLVNVMD